MRLVAGSDRAGSPAAVTVGVFDGVHRGHQALIGRLVDCARVDDRVAGVLSFDPHPVEVLAPAQAPPLLTTPGRRVELLRELGVDWVGMLDLRQIRTMSPEDFAATVLADRSACRLVIVGEDFRFGRDRRGDVGLLAELGARLGFGTDTIDLIAEGEEAISSTRIRHLIASGDVAGAARLLGRPHRLTGPVIHGEARGRSLDYPTANLACPPGMAMPADGIYAVRAGGRPAVASLGVRPTFGEGGARLLETHIFDFDGDLYGQSLDVDFVARLRGEERFDTVAELVAQMGRDSAAARRILDDEPD